MIFKLEAFIYLNIAHLAFFDNDIIKPRQESKSREKGRRVTGTRWYTMSMTIQRHRAGHQCIIAPPGSLAGRKRGVDGQGQRGLEQKFAYKGLPCARPAIHLSSCTLHFPPPFPPGTRLASLGSHYF
jgi:hypothetical protein